MSSLETPPLQPAKFGWMTLTSRLDNLVMRAPQSVFIPTGGGGARGFEALKLALCRLGITKDLRVGPRMRWDQHI